MSTVIVVKFYWPDSFDAERAVEETTDRLAKQFSLDMFEIEDLEIEVKA